MDRVKQLGINAVHLNRILILIRELRAKAYREDLDPYAVRVGLLVAVLLDRDAAGPRVTNALDEELHQIARQISDEARDRREGP